MMVMMMMMIMNMTMNEEDDNDDNDEHDEDELRMMTCLIPATPGAPPVLSRQVMPCKFPLL